MFKKIKEKITGYSESDIKEANKLTKNPRIDKVRRGTGPNVQTATYQVLLDYSKSKRKKYSKEQEEAARRIGVKLK